jgi:hypothetical protein
VKVRHRGPLWLPLRVKALAVTAAEMAAIPEWLPAELTPRAGDGGQQRACNQLQGTTVQRHHFHVRVRTPPARRLPRRCKRE